MESGQEPGAQWQYGKLASLAYQLDKPIGTSFGDVELFTAMLHEAGFQQVTVHADYQAGQHPADGGRVWTFEATRD